MAKRQGRRSVSVKGTTYIRARRHCERVGRSLAGLVEELLVFYLDSNDEPNISAQTARAELDRMAIEKKAKRERRASEAIDRARDAFTF